jgi:glutathione S-transferase
MKYLTVAEARNMPGLRLVLSMGVPGPWGEAAKAIFHVKGIPYAAVGQEVAEENPDLVAWTGLRNAPIAVYNNERPVDRWLDILMLAERLKAEPALLPSSSEDRAAVMGIAFEICAETGLGWCRREMMMAAMPPSSDGQLTAADKVRDRYKSAPHIAKAATQRSADIIAMLVRRLKAQKAAGSPYLVGKSLTAADLYWASFAIMVEPLPHEQCPMPPYMRDLYNVRYPEIEAVRDPVLLAHRDFIFKNHIGLPQVF